jgi:hypothetical protein
MTQVPGPPPLDSGEIHGTTRRTLLKGGLALGLGALGAIAGATPASAATYTRSINAFTATLNCSTVYSSTGSAIGYSVSSGRWQYNLSVPSVCQGFVGIRQWGFLQVDANGGSVPAFTSGWSTSSTSAVTRTKYPAYPNNQVRTKTVNGLSYSWRTFGIAFLGIRESSTWNECTGVELRYLYQPYYNRWLSKSTWGPWLPV